MNQQIVRVLVGCDTSERSLSDKAWPILVNDLDRVCRKCRDSLLVKTLCARRPERANRRRLRA